MKVCDWISNLLHMDTDKDVQVMYESDDTVVINAWPTPPPDATNEDAEAMFKAPGPPKRRPEPNVTQAHVMRARSLALLQDVEARLQAMVKAERIDHLPAALMACHYALLELNLARAQAVGELPDPIQVLRQLFDTGSLDDHFYRVREGGWDTPRMQQWGEAVKDAHKLMETECDEGF